MATSTITDAAIPASVTIDGEEMFNLLVGLMALEGAFSVEYGMDDRLREPIAGLWQAAFGRMFRDCDRGLEDGCEGADACKACNGDEREADTPLYRLALERADAIEMAA